MRAILTLPHLLLTFALAHAQVEVDQRIHLTGPDGERALTGLAMPAAPDAALTVEAALIGTGSWAEASANNMAITLHPRVPVSAYRDGLLLRFVAPADIFGPSTISCIGLDEAALRRPDGLPPMRGQIVPGAVIEVLYAADGWILTNAPERGCPPGTVAISERTCIEREPHGNSRWYAAADRCTNRGGRLCSWDEFYLACMRHSDQLTGLLSAWEWIDDATNHWHTSVQVGMGSCTAERWAVPAGVTLGPTRCCFVPR
ncbi:MAG: hypothetical protein KF797_10655 [Flavobacteriales bacterium]|nr:hypothetical protein [Flavobacteriales bacterium]